MKHKGTGLVSCVRVTLQGNQLVFDGRPFTVRTREGFDAARGAFVTLELHNCTLPCSLIATDIVWAARRSCPQ